MKNMNNVNIANIDKNSEMKGEKKMNHLMSVLGTNNYQSATYQWETAKAAGSAEEEVMHRYTGRFVQIASLMKILEKHPDTDIRVSIFLTEKARENNWEDRMETGTKGLGSELRTFADRHPEHEIRIETVEIPSGKNKKEQDEIFDAMFRNIDEGETVYFDVTHGFRSIPMLALTIVNYARAVKNAQVGGLYYGAFDAKDEETGNVPLFDMTYCDSVLQWTGAAESFISSGSSNQIMKVYENTAGEDEPKEIRDVVGALNDLTNCLETSRGEIFDYGYKKGGNKSNKLGSRESIRRAYGMFVAARSRMKHMKTASEQTALQNLFEVIAKDTSLFDVKIRKKGTGEVLEKSSIGIAAVRWAEEKNLTQQGLTALESTITTYVGEMCGFRMLFHSDNDNISRAILYSIYGYDNRKDGNEEKIRKMNAVIKEKITNHEEIAACTRDVKQKKNSINHFGMGKGPKFTYTELNDALKINLARFIRCIADDCDCTGCRSEVQKIEQYKHVV